jgi:high-affinity iron transporter
MVPVFVLPGSSQINIAFKSALQSETTTQTGWSIFGLIFIAVLREGFETVLFITAQLQQGLAPVVGAIAGLAKANGIGVMLLLEG